MGRVWRATDVVLHRDVAIKELVPPPGLTPDERREMRERSLREARAIARLNNINVVRVFDVLRTDADPWIVMEYVPSRSLQDTLASDGPYPPVRAAEIGLGVLGALRAAHRAGVVHRDVKPGNVLISEDGRVVLTDFGLATVPGDPNVTRTGLVLGSPAYIAPERARDGTAGPSADLWSLGATLYAAVEGASPFARPSAIATLAALATENPPPARNAGPLKPVLNGLLRKDPTHRINADEAERLLLRAAGRRSKLTFPMSPTMRRPGIGRERPALPPVAPGAPPVTPVVPGPRPPVSPARPAQPAADGRPVFAPGKATVGRRPADTPTRIDTPPIKDKPIGSTGTAPSGTQTPEGAAQSPAAGATMRGSRAYGSITADEVAAHRGRPATARAAVPAAPATPGVSRTPPDGGQALAPTQVDRITAVPAARPGAPAAEEPDEAAAPAEADSAAGLAGSAAAVPGAPAVSSDAVASDEASAGAAETAVSDAVAEPSAPSAGASSPTPVASLSTSVADTESSSSSTGTESSTSSAGAEASASAAAAESSTSLAGAETSAGTSAPAAATRTPDQRRADASDSRAERLTDKSTGSATRPDDKAGAGDRASAAAVPTATVPDQSPAETGVEVAAGLEAASGNATAAGSEREDVTSLEAEAPATAASAPAGAAPASAAAAAGVDSFSAGQDGIAAAESPAGSEPTAAESGTPDAGSATKAAAPSSTGTDGPGVTSPVEGDAPTEDTTTIRRNKPAVGARPRATGSKAARKKGRGRTPTTAASETSGIVASRQPKADTAAGSSAAGPEVDTGSVTELERAAEREVAGIETAAGLDAAGPKPDASVEAEAVAGPETAADSDIDSPAEPATKPAATESAAPATNNHHSTSTARKAPRRSIGGPVAGVPVAAGAPAAETRLDLTEVNGDGPPPANFAVGSTRPAWQPMPAKPADRPGKGLTVFGTTLSRQQTLIGAAILLAIVLALVLIVPRAFGGDSDDENTGSKTGPAPVASSTGKSATSAAAVPPTTQPASAAPTSAAPASSTPTGDKSVVLPAGWHLYKDRSGFTVPVPANWTVSHRGTETYFTEQGGQYRLLIVDQTTTPAPNPVADWTEKESERIASYRNYDRISIKSVNYWDKAADWEYTRTSDNGNPLHVVKRGFITAKNQAYGITWSTSAKDWTGNLDNLQLIYQGFVPARS